MELELIIVFFKGFAVGFAGAVPLGPLGIICIRRTLQSGFLAGVIGGIGTAVADSLFGVVCAFGLTTIAHLMQELEQPLRLVGGIIMLGIAIHVLRHKVSDEQLMAEAATTTSTHTGNMISNFFITISNPVALVFFTIGFASLGIAENQTFLKSCFVVTGVFSGSMVAWVLLAGLVSLKRHSKSMPSMAWINRFTAFLLLACAAWALGGIALKA